MPCEKVSYTNYFKAKKAVNIFKRIFYKTSRIYKCDECNLYHLTTEKAHEVQKYKRKKLRVKGSIINKLMKGTELTTTLWIAIEQMERIQQLGSIRKNCINLKRAIENQVSKNIDILYKNDEEVTHNVLKLKTRMIEQIANVNDADMVLLSDHINLFFETLEDIRKEKVVYFDKI